MKELTEEKKRIIDDHYNKIMGAYDTMAKSTDHALKDSETVGKGNLSMLKIFKSAVEVKRKFAKTPKMDSEEKSEFAKLEYERSKEVFNEVKKLLRSGTDSLIKDIDEQMEIIRKEIAQIDNELNSSPDDARTRELIQRKKELLGRDIGIDRSS